MIDFRPSRLQSRSKVRKSITRKDHVKHYDMQSHTAEYTLNPIMDRERAIAPLALQIWAPDSVYPLATYILCSTENL